MELLKVRRGVMQTVSFFKCTALLLLCALFLLVPAKEVRAGNANVDWTQVEQKISGFGAASADMSWALTDDLAKFFFDKDTGIGLSCLKTMIPPDSSDWESETGAMLKAQSWGVTQIWSAPGSPPADWKDNGDTFYGGRLEHDHYQDYANYLTQFIKYIKTKNVELYAISVQNEPDVSAPWKSCRWSPAELQDFIKNYLKSTFAANNITTKVIMPESCCDNHTLSDQTLNDPDAAVRVDIIAEHLYGVSPSPYPLAASKGKEYWETEIADSNKYDRTMNSGLYYATLIHNCLVNARMNAFHYFWLAPMPADDNQGLIHWTEVPIPNTTYETPKRTYCLGNFSKFIRPGYNRIGATANPTTNVSVSAYKNASTGDFVIVAINKSDSWITQKFVLNNFTAETVTPWITDGTRNLIKQGSVNVSGGNTFSYSLPPQSVCSFVGPSIVVTSPTSGEDWVIGSTRTIGWTSSGITGNVKIELGRPLGCSYSWSDIATSTSNDGTHSWTVLAPALSNCIIRVTSLNTPAIYDDSYAFDIVVAANRAPTAGSLTVSPSSVYRGQKYYSLSATGFSDPDGDTLTYAWGVLNPGATSVYWWTGSGPSSYTNQTAPSDLGDYKFYCYAIDPSGAKSAEKTATLTVYNRAPTVGSITISPNPANRGQSFTVCASASDPDGDALTYWWGWQNPGSSTVTWWQGTSCFSSTAPTTAGAYTIHCIAQDSYGAQSPEKTATLTVK